MQHHQKCPFCDEEIPRLKALLAEMEARAPEPTIAAPAAAQQHTTAVLMDTLIERLLGELGHPMRVVRLLVARVFATTGIHLELLGMVEAQADGPDVLPTTDDVRDLSEAELAEMKDLPSA